MKADTPIDRGVRFFDLCPSARFPIYSQLHPEYSQLLLIYSQLSCFYSQLRLIYSQLPPKTQKKKHRHFGNAPPIFYYLKKSIRLGWMIFADAARLAW